MKDLPAKLTLTPALPELRGNSRSTFEYQLTIKNESGKRIVANLAATAPQNFEVSFTEQYGSQELNAVPLDAGQSKDVKLKVRPPNTIGVGPQKVTARATVEDATATAELGLEITGTPKIEIAGREGRLNASATAGQETSIPVIVANTGTATAEAIELTGSAPSGWKIEADPKVLDRLPPNETKEVQFKVTPTPKAVAGDYVTTVRAAARGESASQTFRVAVATSTQWGFIGAGHHRYRAAGAVRCGDEVRAAMSNQVIEAQNLTKRYDGVPVVKGISFDRWRRVRSSGCSAPTAPARPRPS